MLNIWVWLWTLTEEWLSLFHPSCQFTPSTCLAHPKCVVWEFKRTSLVSAVMKLRLWWGPTVLNFFSQLVRLPWHGYTGFSHLNESFPYLCSSNRLRLTVPLGCAYTVYMAGVLQHFLREENPVSHIWERGCWILNYNRISTFQKLLTAGNCPGRWVLSCWGGDLGTELSCIAI